MSFKYFLTYFLQTLRFFQSNLNDDTVTAGTYVCIIQTYVPAETALWSFSCGIRPTGSELYDIPLDPSRDQSRTRAEPELTVKYATDSETVTIQNRLVLLKKALPSAPAIAARAGASAKCDRAGTAEGRNHAARPRGEEGRFRSVPHREAGVSSPDSEVDERLLCCGFH